MPNSTDNQHEKQPLLETHGIITTPDVLDYENMREVEWALACARTAMRGDKLQIRIVGWGGYDYCARALIDLVNSDENIEAVLFGTAISAHSILWAGCKNRTVMKNATLGVHRGHLGLMGNLNSNELDNFASLMRGSDDWATKIYADACGDKRYKKKFWKELTKTATESWIQIDGKTLVEKMEMGKWYKEE